MINLYKLVGYGMSNTSKILIGRCRLCLCDDVRLVDSHIIPDFVFRWLKKNSFTGYFRTSTVPNNRTQRGLTKNWLCAKCDNETFGSKLEEPFAKTIFSPVVIENQNIENLKYDEKLLRFCVSVLWRVLLVGIDEAKTKNVNNNLDAIISYMEECSNQWREYLLDEQSRWIGNNIYFLFFGEGGLSPKDVGPGMHSYSRLSNDMGSLVDPVMWDPMIFAKFGPFITFTPLTNYYVDLWEKQEIFPIKENAGEFLFVDRKLPEHFNILLRNRAEISLNLFSQMSDTQQAKVLKIKNDNLIEYKSSYEYKLGSLDRDELGTQ